MLGWRKPDGHSLRHKSSQKINTVRDDAAEGIGKSSDTEYRGTYIRALIWSAALLENICAT